MVEKSQGTIIDQSLKSLKYEEPIAHNERISAYPEIKIRDMTYIDTVHNQYLKNTHGLAYTLGS